MPISADSVAKIAQLYFSGHYKPTDSWKSKSCKTELKCKQNNLNRNVKYPAPTSPILSKYFIYCTCTAIAYNLNVFTLLWFVFKQLLFLSLIFYFKCLFLSLYCCNTWISPQWGSVKDYLIVLYQKKKKST